MSVPFGSGHAKVELHSWRLPHRDVAEHISNTIWLLQMIISFIPTISSTLHLWTEGSLRASVPDD